MPRAIPPPLGLALAYLRLAKGWKQEELAKAAGTAATTISGYEKGTRAGLDWERLEELAAILGHDGAAIDLMLLAVGGVAPGTGQPEGGEPEGSAAGGAEQGRRVRGAALRLGLLVAGRGEARMLQLMRARRRERARAEADRRWAELAILAPGDRRFQVERSPALQSEAMCARICAESERAAADDAARALELARLARRVAELAPGEPAAKAALLGYASFFVVNAHRVGADLAAAEAACEEAVALWRAGKPADRELLAEWRVLDLEASLRRDLRSFDRAVELLDRARAVAPAEMVGRILLKRAFTLEQAGQIAAAVEALREAAPLAETMDDPRLAFGVRFNLATNLCHLGRYAEANDLLGDVGERALGLGNELDLLRVLWLSGRVAAGRGRSQEARIALDRARREFAAHGDGYDAALVSLELAVVELEAGRTGEVRALAGEMLPVFQRLGFDREAMAAVRVFWASAQAGTATAELGRRLLTLLERGRPCPRRRLGESG
jgi:transcriptional regulator with XRE-family HTH domain